jgi:Uma2 family endonuclease
MTLASPPTEYTPAEIARLSEQTGKLYELVGGRLVEKDADSAAEGVGCMSMRSNSVAAEIVALLRRTYPLSRAYLFVEQPTYCFKDPTAMRRPDVALVWTERLPGGLTDDELTVPPDLVVESASPTNTYYDLLDRVEEYLTAGTPLVWIVGPSRRSIHVFRKEGTAAIFRQHDTFRDEPLLPGLVFKVSEIFPPAVVAP